ncbi:MAG: DUF4212 domain-containing protein [Bacteroidetes bacterium]|jgi:putative solute:sodium symporter small subunit|nr:DUF4212 domain-containing protein [Bacteroidota bacterium]
MAQIDRETYWRKQLQRTIILLVVWFVVGYLMSIFLIEPLNTFTFGGIPFGFWMAQQGSIFVFISLIFIYAYATGKLDERAGLAESDDATSAPGAAH